MRSRRVFSRLALLATAALTGLANTPTMAQDFEFVSPVRLQADGEVIDTGPHVAHSGPAFADINEDGVTDLLVGNFRGTMEYFQNVGTNQAPEYATGKMLEAEGDAIKIKNW